MLEEQDVVASLFPWWMGCCTTACVESLLFDAAQEDRVSEEQDVVASFLHLVDGLLRAAPGMLLHAEQLPTLVTWACASLRVRLKHKLEKVCKSTN